MQTEQFDDEFRKKLLGIDPITNEDEVDRIYTYVSSGGKTVSHFSWSKFLAYGLAAMLLIGSLTFNYIQNNTNKQLASSVDSLKTVAGKDENEEILRERTLAQTIVKTDTVYLTRYRDRFLNAADQNLYSRSDDNIRDSPELASGAEPQVRSRPAETLQQNPFAATLNMNPVAPTLSHNPEMPTDQPGLNQIRSSVPQRAKAYSLVTGEELKDFSLQNNYVAPSAGSPISGGDQIAEHARQVIDNLLLKPAPNFDPAFAHFKPLIITAPIAGIGKKQSVPNSRAKREIKWQNLHYYAGASFDAGKDLVGASALGEFRLSPKWSFQSGLRWQQIIGSSYYTAQQYQQETGNDFRKLYAPYVAESADLLNIEQFYHTLQVPLNLAYHYKLALGWNLRFGLGTDLTVYTAQRIHFDYKEDNQSFDQGDHNATLEIPGFNNMTAQIGLEKDWKRFLFRASPFGTWQFRNITYARNNLSAGVRLQVLYRIK